MCVHFRTAPLPFCSILCHPSTPIGCVQAAFQHSWTAGVVRRWDFTVITDSSGTAASENLWSVDFGTSSAHSYSLFMKLSEIWSGAKTERFILKLVGCFSAVSVSDFLSRSICSFLSSGKNRSIAYLLWRHSHWLESKHISSAAVSQLRRTAHTSSGI